VTDDDKNLVPVWTLATSGGQVPALPRDAPMTADRLAALRTVLATFAESPVATLELHPLPRDLDRSRGISLDAASPLAHHLSQLISNTTSSASTAAPLAADGEGLYRMVVPAKVAAQIGKGLVRPMRSKAAAGGIHSALVNSSGIAYQATFVPVTEVTAAGAAGGAAGTAGVAAASAGTLTVAAPLVLMAVAVGVSAYADYQRQQAVRHITELLEQLHEDNLNEERRDLEGCRDAIDKATAILLDQGKIGHSLGLDSAVHDINKAIADAERRLARWDDALDKLSGDKVEVADLVQWFPGIDKSGGEFRAHLELAALAIALKRRVVILQAVDHAQADTGNPFDNFVRELKSDHQRLERLESRIATVLVRLSSLEITRSHRRRDVIFTANDVDELMRAARLVRELGAGVEQHARDTDVAIEIARDKNGSVIVFPALAA
jgi:hypothetical protein